MSEKKNTEKIDETFQKIGEITEKTVAEQEKNESEESQEEEGQNSNPTENNLIESSEEENLEYIPESSEEENIESIPESSVNNELENLLNAEDRFNWDIIGRFLINKDYEGFYFGLKALGASNSNQVRILEILAERYENQTVTE